MKNFVARLDFRVGLMFCLLAAGVFLYPRISTAAPTVLDWSEEVKLHDGQIIVIKRHDELGAFGFPLAHRGARKYWQFCYAPMGIHWKSKPAYFPETFDIVDGKAYVKVSIGGCELCMLHGYPDTDALYFVWEGGVWKKIDYKDFPKGLRYNMLNNTDYDDDGTRDVRGLVTIAQKEERDPNMYWLMRKKPEITGLNETVAYRGACIKCRGYRVDTTSNSEVFLPAASEDCK
jgi:hypothetical protein